MTHHRPYSGSLKAIIFDWAGTTVDYGCFAPVAVFIEVFKRRGVTINIAQVRAPMGLEKRDHIRAIAQQPEIAAAWQIIHGQPYSEADIDGMYVDSVTVQVECVADFADLIPGTLETVQDCRAQGLKIGTTTGYSRAVMDVLLCPSQPSVTIRPTWLFVQRMCLLVNLPLDDLLQRHAVRCLSNGGHRQSRGYRARHRGRAKRGCLDSRRVADR